ncbi:MAG: hypothetical protein NT065_04150 [Chlamydiae bacterium]|nr:hypothetical protein [Chlamydiota bacterium]
MNTRQDQFQALIALTLQYIKEEYNSGTSILCGDESYPFFKSLSPPKVKKIADPRPNQKPPAQIAAPLSPKRVPFVQVKEIISDQKIDIAPQEPITKQPSDPFPEDLKKQVEKHLSYIKIIKNIPSDEGAQILASGWKHPCAKGGVLLFSFTQSPNEKSFLSNIKKAIESHFCSCEIIDVKEWEDKKEWNRFFILYNPRLILGDPNLFQTKNLLPFYKENAVSKQMFLNSYPFMLLKPLSTYLDTPEHKKSLWNQLCTILKNP